MSIEGEKMREFEHILFDLDGTLTDSAEGILESLRYMFSKVGMEETEEALRMFIGPPLKSMLMTSYDFSESVAEEMVGFYRESYSEKGMFMNKAYDGIIDCLEALWARGKKLYVATAKPEPFASIILKEYGLISYFEYIGACTLDGTLECKQDVIADVLKKCSLPKASTVMVGDRNHDVLGAKACGIKSIGVLYGYGDEAELRGAGADYLVADIPTLTDMLKE